MSYFIEDDHKVIKTTRGYIFMVLGGDNNVTTNRWVGGNKKWAEVRARSWFHYNHQILDEPESVITAFCERSFGTKNPEYQLFMKGSKWLCNKDMSKYFRNGMKRAQTLEQLILANRGQSLDASVRHWPDKDSCSSVTELSQFLHTTEELEEWLDLAKPLREKYLADGKDCYICLSFCGEKPLRYSAPETVGKVVIKTTSRRSSGYVRDYAYNRQLNYTANLDEAVVFDSEEDARLAIGPCWRHVKFVSLESQQRANKPKPYMLQFGAGKLGGQYLSRTTKNTTYGIFSQDRAKKFATDKEAIRYAKFLRERGCDESRFGKITLVNSEDGSRTVLAI